MKSRFTSGLGNLLIATAAMAVLVVGFLPSYVIAADAGGSASVGQAVTDTAISTKVRAKLLTDKRIENSDIDVSTANGIVTLSGKAATDTIRDTAESIAGQTEGVVRVDNKLTIASEPSLGDQAASAASAVGHTVKKTASKTGKVISDSYVTSKIKSQLLAAKDVSGTDIEVNTVAGAVTLAGQVQNKREQRKAIRIAKATDGVKSVDATALVVAAK